jgi:hypothetical protein
LFSFLTIHLSDIGERGNAWIRHELKLEYQIPFQVLIEGVVGTSFLSDIGLDDTIFAPECNAYSSSTLPITTITSTIAPKPCDVPDQVRCAGYDICIDKNMVTFLTSFFYFIHHFLFY